MSTISGRIQINASFSQVSATLPGGPTVAVPESLQFALQGNGTALDQADLKHTHRYTLAATPLALDLTSLLDTDGAPVNFKRVRSLTATIKDGADSHTVLFGYATTTTNACTSLISNPGQLTICPSTAINNGGLFLLAPNTTGYLVGPTSKLIQFDPGANTVVLDVEIVGASV